MEEGGPKSGAKASRQLNRLSEDSPDSWEELAAAHMALQGQLAEAQRALDEAEERCRALAGVVTEQQRRVRNILAVVRSVFARTIDTHSGLNGAADHFRGRLDALARTHGALLRTTEASIDLEEMIWNEFIGHGAQQDARVEVAGPVIRLRGKAAESMGLTIHELATNSTKFGALTHPAGRLWVTWEISNDGSGERLAFIWEESGIALDKLKPARVGFGRELIEEALPYELGARTQFAFTHEGLRCSIDVPLGPDVILAPLDGESET